MNRTLVGFQFVHGCLANIKAARWAFSPSGALTMVVSALVGTITAHAQSHYQPYSFTTFAGLAGTPGSVDGTGNVARFDQPFGVAVDGAANVFVGDTANHTIRKITSAGDVSTLAGQAGSPGSADGQGALARFTFPEGVAVDLSGNVYVADSGNHTIRKIDSSGLVSTLAGLAGNPGSTDGMGSAARFDEPSDVAVDEFGNVFVGDSFNNTIRMITPAGVVSTIAGLAGQPGSADGTASAARFNFPAGVAVDLKANIYVADNGNHTIRQIAPGGIVSTLAGLAGNKGSADGTGNAARFNSPFAVAVDNPGNVYVADSSNHTIRKVTPAGAVSTLAGLADTSGSSDGAGSAARFDLPEGLAVDRLGNLLVADTLNDTIRLGALAPPVITSPLTFVATRSQPIVYQFEALGATSLSVDDLTLPPGLSFDSVLSAIIGTVTDSEGTFQVALSASNATGTTNATLSLTIQPLPAGPVIISSTSATGRTGSPFTFQVLTTGATSAARLSASNLPPGLTVDAVGAVTGVISGTPTTDGSYGVTLTVVDGQFTAIATLELTLTSDPTVPVIISPSSATIFTGQPFNYAINAPSSVDPDSDPTGYASQGNLPPGLGLDAFTGIISGTPQARSGLIPSPQLSGGVVTNVELFASNSQGTGTIPLVFFQPPIGTVNISTRLDVGTSDNVLIGGFIITGNAPKQVLLRGIGPSLPVPGALQDTTLELHDSSGLLGSNDNWRDTQEQEIIATTIPPTNDLESAIVAILDPGPYTVILSGKNSTTGVALVEVYDLGTASFDVSSQAQLVNISTRALVQTGDNVMIGGFIVSGDNPSNVLLRAIGPELTGNGVADALQDPTMELHDSNGALLAFNDDWQTDQEQEIIDTTIPPTDPRESAIVSTLTAGAYTAIVQGKNSTTGVGLVEVYVLP